MIRFNIVIPTCKRLDTLKFTLKTCLEQDYPDFKVIILVNDCAMTDEYVKGLNDGRVHSFLSNRPLSMTDNWERALSIIEDDSYVLFLGDDDGLLPDSLICAERLIRINGCKALSWKKAEYCWPGVKVKGYENYCRFSLSSKVLLIKSDDFLGSLFNFKVPYDFGPGAYSSFISSAILKKAAAEMNGIFFHAAAPDVFSCCALCGFIPEYLHCEFALSINGASSHSNGISYVHRHDSLETADYKKNSALHKRLSHAPSVLIAVADAMLWAKDSLPVRFAAYEVSIPRLLEKITEEISSGIPSKNISFLQAAISDIAARNGIESPAIPPPKLSTQIPEDFICGTDDSGTNLTLSIDKLGAFDVYQASKVLGVLKPLRSLNIRIENWDIKTSVYGTRKAPGRIERTRKRLSRFVRFKLFGKV